jgi:hypothetical protein
LCRDMAKTTPLVRATTGALGANGSAQSTTSPINWPARTCARGRGACGGQVV